MRDGKKGREAKGRGLSDEGKAWGREPGRNLAGGGKEERERWKLRNGKRGQEKSGKIKWRRVLNNCVNEGRKKKDEI